MYLERSIDGELLNWMVEKLRKPLLLRGARQVGKTLSVRKLGENFEVFLEINFEEHKKVRALFSGDLTPEVLCENLSVMFEKDIEAGRTLLFFDEIQACIPAISALRYFYEKMPELHVIAAGSLLEFALEEIPSFGVGRIRSLFMYPMSFDEFLAASGNDRLLQAKKNAHPLRPLAESVHEKLVDLLLRFMLIGGMPEVVASYVTEKNLRKCQLILNDLIISYRSDFTKYRKRIPSTRIQEVFESVVFQAGGKFKYSRVSPDLSIEQVKQALNLLIMAGIVLPVTHTSANGIPLGAETNLKKRKMLLLDTGMFQRIMQLDMSDHLFNRDVDLVNKGKIAEQFVGLEIVKSAPSSMPADLYYWHREALNSSAEVDYLLQRDGNVIPVEVKSGTKGSMTSMFRFLEEKQAAYGCRLSLENFAQYDNIKVYPLYACSNLI